MSTRGSVSTCQRNRNIIRRGSGVPNSEGNLQSQLDDSRIICRSERSETACRQIRAALDTHVGNTEIAEAQHAIRIAIHVLEVHAIEQIERVENQLHGPCTVGPERKPARQPQVYRKEIRP